MAKNVHTSNGREARKIAKIRLRERKRLLRRAGDRISDGARSEIKAHAIALEGALEDGSFTEIAKASERLSAIMTEHLDRYRKPAWRESAESILVAVMVALLLRSFVVEAFKIPSGSMIPTLAIGDQIFVNKFIYGIRVPFTSIRLIEFDRPQRGEVIVFRFPGDESQDFIKRVVGLPGDQIEVRRGVVYVNDAELPRERLGRRMYWDRSDLTGDWSQKEAIVYQELSDTGTYEVLQDPTIDVRARDLNPYIVPQDSVFVMGDNRDHSHDSREWGSLPISNILGRSLFVWWSWGADCDPEVEGVCHTEGLSTDRLFTWID